MITVHLYGDLSERFGDSFEFEAKNVPEALRALDANLPGFKSHIRDHQYHLIVDGEPLDPDHPLIPVTKEIHLAPTVQGGFVALLAPLLGAIGITGTAATIVSGLILVGLMLGVSLLMAPKKQKEPTRPAEPDKLEGFSFGAPINVTEQGVAVPLFYGEGFAGSVVVSTGIDTVQLLGAGGVRFSNYPIPGAPPGFTSLRDLTRTLEIEHENAKGHRR